MTAKIINKNIFFLKSNKLKQYQLQHHLTGSQLANTARVRAIKVHADDLVETRVYEVDPPQARIVVEARRPVQQVHGDRYERLGLDIHPEDDPSGTNVQ